MTCPDELASLQARLQGSAAMHLAPWRINGIHMECWLVNGIGELPSGKLLHNYGKIHHVSWENPL